MMFRVVALSVALLSGLLLLGSEPGKAQPRDEFASGTRS